MTAAVHIRRTARPEQDFQRQAAALLDFYYPEGSDVFCFHPPLGGKRSKVEAAIMKGLGVKAGVPDIVLMWRGGCAGIELKSAEGRLRPSQKAVREWWAAAGIPYLSAFDLEEVQKCLRLLISERGMPMPKRGRL